MQISPSRIFGNCGAAGPPERFTKSDGIKTLVRKLRLCQSARGRSRTRVERFTGAPSRDVCRTMFRRLFFGNRIGTVLKGYETVKTVKSVKKVQKSIRGATFLTFYFVTFFNLVTFSIWR